MIDSIGLFLLQMMAKLVGDDKKLLQFFRRKAAVQIVFALDDPLFDALMDGQSLGSEHQFFQSPIPGHRAAFQKPLFLQKLQNACGRGAADLKLLLDIPLKNILILVMP